MTICVAVCVHDGVVFAADSATSIVSVHPNGQSVISNVYCHGVKVFNLYRDLPICGMTAGMGSINNAPIHALTKDFRKLLASNGTACHIDRDNYTIREIAEKALHFFFDAYQAGPPIPPPHSFEFWIGGYSSGATTHELWKIAIVDGNSVGPDCLSSDGACGIWVGGQPEPIYRLLIGFDPSLDRALGAAGVPAQTIPQLVEIVQQHSQRTLCDSAMPIQDAIDLADYLVDMTKKYFRFLPGADTVGGDTDIAAVTRHEKFKWIKRKHFYPQSLNPLETDHDH